eukprot:10529050-Ditylum_brightwellii.AAC.1
MPEIPLCKTTIPGVAMENIKQAICFSNHSVEIMLDTAATRTVIFSREDFITYKDKTCVKVFQEIAWAVFNKKNIIVQYQLQADESTKTVVELKT